MRIRCRLQSPYRTVLPYKDARRSCREVAPVRSRCPCIRRRRYSGSFSSDRTIDTVVVPVFSSDRGVFPSSFGVFDVFGGVSSSSASFDADDDDAVDVPSAVVSSDLACLSFAASSDGAISGDLSVAFFVAYLSSVVGVFSFSVLPFGGDGDLFASFFSCVGGGGGEPGGSEQAERRVFAVRRNGHR